MRVINLDNPYGSLGIRPLSRCRGGVQEIEFGSEGLGQVVPKLKQGEIAPLQGPTSERFELRAGSGLKAENSIDVRVRDGASTEPRMGKSPRNGRGCAGAFRAGWERSGSGARWWAIGEVPALGDSRRWLSWTGNWRTLIVLRFRRPS